MICRITIPATLCQCDKCGHSWTSYGDAPPKNCRNQKCRSREWNGKKLLLQSHVNEIKLPSPRKGGRPKNKPVFDYSEDL